MERNQNPWCYQNICQYGSALRITNFDLPLVLKQILIESFVYYDILTLQIKKTDQNGQPIGNLLDLFIAKKATPA